MSHSQPVNSVSISSFLSSFLPPLPTSRSLFPLPLLVFPARPFSFSRRVIQSYAKLKVIIRIANNCIRSLNTIHHNYPSSRYARVIDYTCSSRSSVPSPAQKRLHDSILKAAAQLVSSSRQHLKSAATISVTAAGSTGPERLITGRPDSSSTAPRVSPIHCALACDPSGPSGMSLFFTSQGSSSCSSKLNADNKWESSQRSDSVPLVPTFNLSQAFDAFDAVPSFSTIGPPTAYDSATGIVKLVADAVALPNNLHHVKLLTSLPSDIATVYQSPQQLILPSSQVQQRLLDANLRRPRVLADRSEYILLVQRMVKLGMLEFTSSPECINGLFGVPKGDGETRLILDARAANCHFIDPPHVELPTPSHFSRLLVEEGTQFTVAKLDISNFYHQLSLPEWMRPYFALPSLSSSELTDLLHSDGVSASVVAALKSDRPLFPCCTTLPMGFSHSVFLAQTVHEFILYTYSSLSPSNNILNLLTPRLDRSVHGLYIDDNVLLDTSLSRAAETYSMVLDAYSRAGLPVKLSKCQPPTLAPVTVLGVQINGSTRRIYLSPDRHAKVMMATLKLLQKPCVSGKELAVVLGGWTWQMLLCRLSLVAVKHCYKYVERYMQSSRILWNSARRELVVLMGLSPLLAADLSCQFADKVIATDASSQAAGVVSVETSKQLTDLLWPSSCVTSCSLLSLTHPKVSSAATSSVYLRQPSVSFRHQHINVNSVLSSISSMLPTLSWSTIISHPWKQQQHINQLELRSVLLAFRWLLSHTHWTNIRQFLLTDSAVVYHILKKGRSNSPPLLALTRRFSAMALAAGIGLLPIWIPSALNPADAPSRCTVVPASTCLD